MTEFQPTLPVEAPFTETELNFMEESPPGLFPENQNSNFGYIIRKLFSDQMHKAAQQIETLYTERFASGADIYLPTWELDYGLPVAPTGKTVADRRSIVMGREITGPFTRNRVKAILYAYLGATLFGTPITLTPDGVPLTAGGVPLSGEAAASLETLFRVYENIQNFSYEVWIKNTTTPDVTAITRELARITPAGIQFTLDNTSATILDYFKEVRNKQPVWYSRLAGNANDSSGYANHGTLNGAPAAFASPGLLVNPAGGSSAAYDFDGVNDYISVPDANQLDTGDLFSVEIWINADAFTGNPRLMSKGGSAWELYVSSTGQLRLQQPFTATIYAHSSILLSTATTYHIVAVKDGASVKLYVNGVDRAVPDVPATVSVNNANALEIGRLHGTASNWFDGRVDEPALYNHAMPIEQVLLNYNTGKNIG